MSETYAQQLDELVRVTSATDALAIRWFIDHQTTDHRSALASAAITLAKAGMTTADIANHGLWAVQQIAYSGGRRTMSPVGAAEAVAHTAAVCGVMGDRIRLLSTLIIAIREAS